MADTPEAAAPATEANPTPTPNEAPTQEPEISAEQVAQFLGTNAETLGKFQKFVEANGKFDAAFSKLKTDISNPEPKPEEKPAPAPAPEKPAEQPQAPTSQPEPPKTPEGAISQAEFMAQQYFKALAGEEKYAPIAKEIQNGDLLKEMSSFNIQPLNPDGSINDTMVRRYLDLKAQTVPAAPTETEPNMSNAPTVQYEEVGDTIKDEDQAYRVLMQPGHPAMAKAEEYIKKVLNPDSVENTEKK